MPNFLVDNKELEAKQGTTLLKACLDNQIYIPNLCYLEGIDPPSVSCRMCFVEIEGERQPVRYVNCNEPLFGFFCRFTM
jgi:NADH dehydrogenase/NADH:ubiquinone oxidoreductase subunit G